jgi:peptidoglycan/LPS O-acetylase OafA/YrhL
VTAAAPEITDVRTDVVARRRYLAGLDGLRALAVTAVVLFHGEWSFARGGYLGVSLFFTISGFLIISLLLVERGETGRVHLSRFWTHRARRLLPAAFVTIAGTWIAAGIFHLGNAANNRGDAFASMFYFANWRFIATSQSYDALFSAPSPFLHFWSLSIEEQFYLLIAPSLVLLFLAPARWRRALIAGFVALIGIAYLIALQHPTTAYLDTFTRLPEVAAGGVLAFVIGRRCFGDRRRPLPILVRYAVDVASVVALVVFVVFVARAGTPQEFAAAGWLPIVGCCSAVMVAGCALEGTLFSRALALRPLPALGRISYALYLVHWPIFLVLTEARVGFGGVPLFAVRVLFSLGVALLMFRWIEGPARRNLHTPRAAFAVLVPAAVVVCVILIAVAPAAQTTQPTFAQQMHTLAQRQKTQTIVPGLPTVEMFGDSTALLTGWGLQDWGGENKQLQFYGSSVQFGCSIGRGGTIEYEGKAFPVDPKCDWSKNWTALIAQHPRPDVAIVLTGPWDVTNRKLPGDDTWRAPGDPKFDRYMDGEINAVLDMFHAHGIPVVWLLALHNDVGRAQVPRPPHPYPESDPARIDRLNQMIRGAAATRPDVTTIDLGAHLRALPGGEMDPKLRPDGVHFTLGTGRVFANWLGPQVVDAVHGLRTRLGLPPIAATPTSATR